MAASSTTVATTTSASLISTHQCRTSPHVMPSDDRAASGTIAPDRIYQRSQQSGKELKDLVTATGTTLTDLHDIGPSGAERLLVALRPMLNPDPFSATAAVSTAVAA